MIFRRESVQGDRRWFPRPNDIIAYNLLDAMRHPSCPLCALTQRREDGFLFSLFWENVNSPHIRQRLRESLGFCDLHTRTLRLAANQPWVGPFGIAILYRDFVDTVRGRLRRPDPLYARLFTKNSSRVRNHLSPSRRCWLCEVSEETEDTYLDALVEGLDTSPVLRDKYSESHGLCILHAERAARSTGMAETRSALVRAAFRQSRALSDPSSDIADLERFLLGYRSAAEFMLLANTLDSVCPPCEAEAIAKESALQGMPSDDLTADWRRLCSRHRSQATLSTLRRFGAAEGFVQNLVQCAVLDADESEKGYECPVCYRARQAAREAVLRAGEDMGRTACLFHFRMALSTGNPAQTQACVDSLATRLDSLSRDLGELIRKNEYRFSHEPLGEEMGSWLRALVFFGSERAAP